MQKIRTISFQIEAVPPFRLDYTVWCLRRRPENRMDVWEGNHYRKIVVLKGIPHLITAEQKGLEEPALNITVRSRQMAEDAEDAIRRLYTNLLGLEMDLSGFYRVAEQNSTVNRIVQRFLGLKPPRFLSLFESIANGIACQQISLSACIQILSRMTEALGMKDERLSELHAFPRPADFHGQIPESLKVIGFSHQKSTTIINLARSIHEGTLDLGITTSMADDEAEGYLRRIKGVGPWTARYVLLRGMGRLHVFPSGDVGAHNALMKLFSVGSDSPDVSRINRILASLHPYGGLLYFHLLVENLAQKGFLNASP